MRKFPRVSLSTNVAAAALASSMVLVSGETRAAQGDLYAATGVDGSVCEGGTLSSLYELDPATGAADLIAAITIDSTQVRNVSGLAVHPSTGVLYAVMGGQATDGSDCSVTKLLTVDAATGEASIVGNAFSLAPDISDIAFDPFGTLYGWSEGLDDELVTIDIVSGTATQRGSTGLNTFATGLASDSMGRLFLKFSGVLVRINQYTAQSFDAVSLDRTGRDMLAFDASDVLFSGTRTNDGFTLFTIDSATGTTTAIGDNSVLNISALAFDRGVMTPPEVADLTIGKEVDDLTVVEGNEVVFTLTLFNDGPATAENTVLSDLLPSAFSFVSSSGDGTYDDVTGEWTVASIAANATASIEITALGVNPGIYTNWLEVVASDAYDPDSVPGSEDTGGDTYTWVTGEVLPVPMFSIERDESRLWVVDSDFAQGDMAQEISLSGHTICGGNGLATQPETGALFAVLAIDDCTTRTLVTIDPATADATEIGDFGGTRIASIAFGADAGTLYATSGNNGSNPRRLFTVDTSDGSLTQKCVLEPSTYGRALAFADGFLYDATYECGSICELVIRVVDTGNLPIDSAETCPGTTMETGLNAEPTALAVVETGAGSVSLLVVNFNAVYRVTIPAADPIETSLLGYLTHQSKGIAFNGTPVTAGNLIASKWAAKSRVKGDRFIDYTISATNNGPDSIDSVVLTDAIPFGTSFVSAGSGCLETGGVVSCDVGSLDSGASEYFSFRVQVTCKKCSSITNTVTVGVQAGDVYDYPFDNEQSIVTSIKGKF